MTNLLPNSTVTLKEQSTLIAENGSTTNVQGQSLIVQQSGSVLVIKSGASLTVEGTGKIVIEEGGFLCVEQGANINLSDYKSLIALKEGAILGTNNLLYPNSQCVTDISFAGNGSVVDYNLDVYLQNETISSDRYVGGRYIYAGREVTTVKPYGDVVVTNNANLILDGKEVFLHSGFECEAGAGFEIK